MTENNTVVYTSTNTFLAANDEPLGFIQEIDIEDVIVDDQKFTDITLYRLANDNEEGINFMRFNSFTLKMCNSPLAHYAYHGRDNSPEVSGYFSPEANVISFKMSLSAKVDGGSMDILKQKIIIRAKSFLYCRNVYLGEASWPPTDADTDKDFENLINILKKKQETVNIKPPAVVLPASEPDVTKKEKKKKIKKNKS